MEDAVKFEIFVLACQIAANGGGAVCRDEILLTMTQQPMQQQITQAMAAWAIQHAGWRVERFGSRRAGRAVAAT
jgi:hypothetical protein